MWTGEPGRPIDQGESEALEMTQGGEVVPNVGRPLRLVGFEGPRLGIELLVEATEPSSPAISTPDRRGIDDEALPSVGGARADRRRRGRLRGGMERLGRGFAGGFGLEGGEDELAIPGGDPGDGLGRRSSRVRVDGRDLAKREVLGEPLCRKVFGSAGEEGGQSATGGVWGTVRVKRRGMSGRSKAS